MTPSNPATTTIPTQADPNADAARARVGTVVEGRWRIEALIAVGGSSAIYAATHRNGMRVAMKVLDPELADNETAVSHFLREGRAVNGIAHPGVVSVLDEGTTSDGAPYLLMPLLDGETAQQRLARHPDGMPAMQALAIVEAVLDVLSAAHARGIVHRDLKPDNVFLERSGAVRVLDFGIAHVQSSDLHLTQHGTVVGTAGYLPPEQARGQVRQCGPRSDLWSAGAMLYTLLTGRVLHEAPNVIQSILRAQHEHLPPARQLVPGVADAVAHVLDGALAFEQSDRWTDAVAMRLAVRAAIDECRRAESRVVQSCAGVTVEALAGRTPTDAPVAFDAVDASGAWAATRRPLAWLAAVCVSAAWIVVAVFLAHGRPAPHAPVVVAAAAPPPALEGPALVTGSTSSDTSLAPLPEVSADALPQVPAPPAPLASAKAPAAKGPHRARGDRPSGRLLARSACCGRGSVRLRRRAGHQVTRVGELLRAAERLLDGLDREPQPARARERREQRGPHVARQGVHRVGRRAHDGVDDVLDVWRRRRRGGSGGRRRRRLHDAERDERLAHALRQLRGELGILRVDHRRHVAHLLARRRRLACLPALTGSSGAAHEHPEVALASHAEGTAREVDETVDSRGHGEQGRTIGEWRRVQFAFDDEEGESRAWGSAPHGVRSGSVGDRGEWVAVTGEHDAREDESLVGECESRGVEGESVVALFASRRGESAFGACRFAFHAGETAWPRGEFAFAGGETRWVGANFAFLGARHALHRQPFAIGRDESSSVREEIASLAHGSASPSERFAFVAVGRSHHGEWNAVRDARASPGTEAFASRRHPGASRGARRPLLATRIASRVTESDGPAARNGGDDVGIGPGMQSFEPRTLGATGRTVGPLGLGSSYGLAGREVERAFDEGVSFFLWGSRRRADFGRGLREVARKDRARATIAIQTYARAAWTIPLSVDSALRALGTDYVDVLGLAWWNGPPPERIVARALALKESGKVRSLMIPCHERPTFATFAADARYDALMVRYNAAHPGSEREVFPHVAAAARRPGVVAFTATRWGSLLDPRFTPKGERTPGASDCYRFALEPPAGPRVPLRSCRRGAARRGAARGASRPARRRRDGVDAPRGRERPRGHQAPAARRPDEARRPHRVVEPLVRAALAAGHHVEGRRTGNAGSQSLRYIVTTQAPPRPEVVLQRDLGVRRPGACRPAAELPHELRALREPGGAERVALREQAARRVGDELAAVGVVAVPDELLGLALLAEAERLVGEELVGGEAVVELDDVHVLGARGPTSRRPSCAAFAVMS